MHLKAGSTDTGLTTVTEINNEQPRGLNDLKSRAKDKCRVLMHTDLYLKTVTATINCFTVQLFFAPVYIDMTADTNHFSIPNLRIAHLITSLGTSVGTSLVF